MIAEILSVGTELLMGQVVDTNAAYIAKRLADIGIDTHYRSTVGDNAGRLAQTMRLALSRSDIVIVSGGLGPTADDLTKETAAEVMGKELVIHAPSLEYIKARFESMHREMTPNNVKQAMFPLDAVILQNPNGTAPGCIMERDGKAIALLPGPPHEMTAMFENELAPKLIEKSSHRLYTRVLRIFGAGESKVEYMLRDMMQKQTNPTIAPYAKTGEMTLRITAACRDEDEGRRLVEPVLGDIRNVIGDVVYSTFDKELHEVIAENLLQLKKTVATAESLTGGMLASKFVSIPGSSEWFIEGCVTYSNTAKHERAEVSYTTLENFGPVSEQTAAEMAEGIRKTSGADIGLATTGIAGPGGGTERTPVGLVYIALADAEGVMVKKLELSGSRERIRYSTCLNVMDMLRRRLALPVI